MILRTKFLSLTATNGAAIYIREQEDKVIPDADPAEYSITDCEFKQNEAVTGNGGALYLDTPSKLMIMGTLFEENKAKNGGAMFFDCSGVNCKVDLSSVLFTRN